MDTSKIYTKDGLLKIIDALPLSISLIDKNRIVKLANKATLIFTDKNETQLLGQVGGDAFECMHKNDVPEGCGYGPKCSNCELRSIITATILHKEPQAMREIIMNFHTSGEKFLRISTLPISIANEEMVLLAMEDITQAKQHEKIRTEKEKLTAVLETAGAVCHEFNQPLQIISGYCDLLDDHCPEDSEAMSMIKIFQEQIQRMVQLNRKLMGISQYKTKPYLNTHIIDIKESSPE